MLARLDEAVGVLDLDGLWNILRLSFITDPSNNHRKIYPMVIHINDNLRLKFIKSTPNGRTLYRQLPNE